jgi:hypothetical protein
MASTNTPDFPADDNSSPFDDTPDDFIDIDDVFQDYCNTYREYCDMQYDELLSPSPSPVGLYPDEHSPESNAIAYKKLAFLNVFKPRPRSPSIDLSVSPDLAHSVLGKSMVCDIKRIPPTSAYKLVSIDFVSCVLDIICIYNQFHIVHRHFVPASDTQGFSVTYVTADTNISIKTIPDSAFLSFSIDSFRPYNNNHALFEIHDFIASAFDTAATSDSLHIIDRVIS